MIVPDVNLLLYAYDKSSPFHETALQWWQQCMSGDELVGLTHPVIFGFVRIGTNARAFKNPMSLEQASESVASWVERSITRILQEDINHVQRVMKLLQSAGSAGGNLVSDAQIAALAIAHKATVHTADQDFIRFNELKSYYPLKK